MEGTRPRARIRAITAISAMLPKALRRRSPLPRSPSPTPHRTNWTEYTFVNGAEAEAALCGDRSSFVVRNDIMALIPEDIKKRMIHHDANAHINGFQELFVHLNNDRNPMRLRKLVEAYFNTSPSLRGHLRQHIVEVSRNPEDAASAAASEPVSRDTDTALACATDVPDLPSTTIRISRYPSLEKLNVIPAAAHDSYETGRRASCFEGTRTKLLENIMSWMGSQDSSQSIFILYGIAGIGKSTVAKTLAERMARSNVLGASFFFSRDEDNRKTARWLFPMLAYHLTRYNDDFARRINDALEANPDVLGRHIHAQFKLLIAAPLQPLMEEGTSVLIVIDALDECDEDDAAIVLSILADNIPSMRRLKVFITARPESHIQAALDQYRDYEQFHMQDIEQSVVKVDIELYLEFRFSPMEVRKALPRLSSPWQPTEEQMVMLVGISGKLFIIASTAASFILDRRQAAPARRIAALLDGVSPHDFTGSKHTTIMDSVYMQIICAAQPDPIDDQWIDRFQTFVGAIVLLQYPLPCKSLARLLDVDEDDINGTLSNLHSLLAPSERDHTYRVHHKSFSDFVCDRDRCSAGPEFYIDPALHHLRIAGCCLRIMNDNLRFNICNLDYNEQYTHRDELRHRVRNSISPHLAYACTHWASHLAAGIDWLDDEVEGLMEVFSSKHLLHWLEVLSIIGRVDIACSNLEMISAAMGRARSHKMKAVREIFNDGLRFIPRNMEIIRDWPMHIYYSALPFTPYNTALFRTYNASDTGTIKVVSGVEAGWNPLIAVLRGHSEPVCAVAFAPDNSRLASASWDRTVRLWDGKTGAHIATLEGHSDDVRSVTFSADGSRLASASRDNTVRLWDGKMGAHIVTLEGHSELVELMTFSADGSRLASASGDNTVQLWNGKTGTHISTLAGHSERIISVKFSADGSKLASVYWDRMVQLWDGTTGAHIATLEGHSDMVGPITFLVDDSRLVLPSDDNKMQLWDAKTGSLIATLEEDIDYDRSATFSADGSRLAVFYRTAVWLWNGKTGAHIATLVGDNGIVDSITFSADGSRLASASATGAVRVWNGENGKHITTLERCSSSALSVAFSADNTRLASAAMDDTIRLWDGKVGAHTTTLTKHSDWITSVTFSADGLKFASASTDKTVRLWDGKTGVHLITLEGHSGGVMSVMFSIDGARIASASSDKTVRLWDSKMGTHIATLEGHTDAVKSVIFSGDGSRIASMSDDGMVRLWDSKIGTHIATLEGHPDAVYSVTFSADGSRLALASRDKTVQLWDSKIGTHIAALEGHSEWDELQCMTFSADGSRLASAFHDADGMVQLQLWDCATGAHIATLEANSNWIKPMAFSEDSLRFVLVSDPVQLCDSKTGTSIPVVPGESLSCSFPALPLFSLCDPRYSSWLHRSRLHALARTFRVDDSPKHPFFFFPPDITPWGVAQSPTDSLIAIGCEDGRVLFMDVSAMMLS